MHKEKLQITNTGLEPFRGEWTRATAAHLLRRTTYGPRKDEIDRAYNLGLEECLSRLTRARDAPAPPLSHIAESEPNVRVGQTWVNTGYANGAGRLRPQSLSGWYFEWLTEGGLTLQHKLTLFWTNFFGMSRVRDHRANYQYLKLFQEVGMVSYREMLSRITVEPAMLEFLHGDGSDGRRPNEDFAREFLELFTVGRGESGEDTNYTPDDVHAFARIFTGWHNHPYVFAHDDSIPIASYFEPEDHDESIKQLSHHFNHNLVRNAGEGEYLQAIKIALNHPETAPFFCRRLYRFFVHYEIPEATERDVIQPLAGILRVNNFRLRPVLTALFGSAHFFDMALRGPMIKNPYDFLMSIVRPFRGYEHQNPNLVRRYQIGSRYANYGTELDMRFLSPESVGGWRAYSMAPQYYRNWISSALMRQRSLRAFNFLSTGHNVNNYRIILNMRQFTESLEQPEIIDGFLDQIILIFLPRQLHPDQVLGLKEQLLQGLPDMEWLRQTIEYLTEPNNQSVARTFENRLRRFLNVVFDLPEFQLQ